MSDVPKVSIILPVHNGERYLKASIDSCLSQTHPNIELIVVDDLSTDRTPEILAGYAADGRVRVVRNTVNQRLPRSLNIGFRHATGDYLTWTSDDNEFDPRAIETMLRALACDPKADFVYTDYWALYEDTGQKERVVIRQPLLLSQRNTLGCCFLYTRKVYQVIGDYNPDYEIVEDYDYWVRVSKRFKMLHLDVPLYLYRYHSRSLTTTRKPNQDLFDAILKYRNGYVKASVLGWTAAHYFENVDRQSGSPKEKRALKAKTLEKIRGLSLIFFVQFMVLTWIYTFFKHLRRLLGRQSEGARS